MKNITVFLSANENIDQEFKDIAYDVGMEIAKSGNNLVTGCSINSCMGTVAQGFDHEKQAGQYHIGVYPKELEGIEEPYPSDYIIKEDTLVERQSALVELGDVYVILAGGFGTLYELFEVLTKMSVNLIPLRKIYLVNSHHFFDGLVKQLTKMVAEGTIKPQVYNMIEVVEHE